MIKAVFLDVDGTLVSHVSRSVPESTRRAIKKLKEKGIKVCMATGRHMLELDELPVRDIEFDGYIMQNGQLCYNGQKKYVTGAPLERHLVDEFVDLFNQKEIPLMFVEENRIYLNFVNEVVEQVQEDISTSVPELGVYEGAPLYQVCAFVNDIQTAFLKEKFTECKITRWHPASIELISGSGGKMAGVQKYMDVLRVTKEEVMAVGDGENDMEMLQFAGVGVCMGNGEDMVKEIADYVTSDVDEDGIEKALIHFNII